MSVDTTAYGGDNGHGGRTYDSVGQILAGHIRRHTAEQKAADDPHSLTDEDIRNLSGETISDLMAKGALGHLGLGARRTPPRRSR
jgi:hypothetical protein